MKPGICVNFGNCTKADNPDRAKHPIQIPDGAEFVCPECGAPLTPVIRPSILPILLIFALLVLCGIGGGAWYLLKPKPNAVAPAGPVTSPAPLRESPSPPAAITPPPTPTEAPTIEATPTPPPVNVLPADPRLEHHRLKAYLLPYSTGSCVRKVGPISPGFPARTRRVFTPGRCLGTSAVQSVQVEARGSATAFESLAKGTCDIGMASRKIKPAEKPPASDLPPEYARLTATAERLSVDFRFRTGSSQLDNKALDDLDRATTYLASPAARGKEVMLIGFADNKGNPQANQTLSNERGKSSLANSAVEACSRLYVRASARRSRLPPMRRTRAEKKTGAWRSG